MSSTKANTTVSKNHVTYIFKDQHFWSMVGGVLFTVLTKVLKINISSSEFAMIWGGIAVYMATGKLQDISALISNIIAGVALTK